MIKIFRRIQRRRRRILTWTEKTIDKQNGNTRWSTAMRQVEAEQSEGRAIRRARRKLRK